MRGDHRGDRGEQNDRIKQRRRHQAIEELAARERRTTEQVRSLPEVVEQQSGKMRSAIGEQDLTGLGVVAKAGGDVGDRADGGVVEAPFKADGSQRGIADAQMRPVRLPPDLI